jgi:hypothetical protein
LQLPHIHNVHAPANALSDACNHDDDDEIDDDDIDNIDKYGAMFASESRVRNAGGTYHCCAAWWRTRAAV